MDKFDLEEKILGGIFGVVAIIAALAEMFVNGLSAATVLAAIKDVFGTLIVVVLFVTVMQTLKPKKPKDFRSLLENSMEKVEANYNPLIRKALQKDTDSDAKTAKLNKVIRYEIASQINVLFGHPCNTYIRFFDIDANEPKSIHFFIRETFFGSTESNPFNAETISSNIMYSLKNRFPEYEITSNIKNGEIIIDFNKVLSSSDDAEKLSFLIDTTILLFVAENKKV